MSFEKISELSDAPEDGRGVRLKFEHPFTRIKYNLALFKAKGKFYVITDSCKFCGGSLGKGVLNGIYASCAKEECAWNIKTGVCKYDRSNSIPTYRVNEQEDGLYINI